MSNDIREVIGDDQFPIYYPMEPRPFMMNGQPSGAAGARAKLSLAVPVSRHFIYGVRISNYYEMPTGLDADGVAVWQAARRYVDGDQTCKLDISQQSIFVGETLQTHLVGNGGYHWHPFPVPFYVAGNNNFGIEITRLTGYPSLLIDDEEVPILPSVGATLVCGVWRSDMLQSNPSGRRG